MTERNIPNILNFVINRAAVLTLRAAIVAERLGFERDESPSFGKALSGLRAQAKGRRLGRYDAAVQESAVARSTDANREIGVPGKFLPGACSLALSLTACFFDPYIE